MQYKFTILSQFFVKKSKMVSFDSSVMKNIVLSASLCQARFPVKLISCTAFGSKTSACC